MGYGRTIVPGGLGLLTILDNCLTLAGFLSLLWSF
jgi:hypothetical protein